MPREGAFRHLIIVSYPRQDKRLKGNGCAIQHDFMLLTVRFVIPNIDYPVSLYDLNLIGRVRHTLWRRLAARSHPAENTRRLKQMILEECQLLPHELLDNLVLSMKSVP
ncbi:hypothetical protein TNCV_4425431 [Trichonephila clavipes]|nr:hypothetical protein TNCV_4425431 [Trichonephila clavipes]